MLSLRAITLVLCCVLTVAGCQDPKVTLGQAAPPWAVLDQQGQVIDQQVYLGQPVLLEFWSVTCSACIASMPMLAEFAQAHHKDVQVILINADAHPADVQKFSHLYGKDIISLHDPLGVTFARYQVLGTPSFFLIDAKGALVSKHIGVMDREELESSLKKL